MGKASAIHCLPVVGAEIIHGTKPKKWMVPGVYRTVPATRLLDTQRGKHTLNLVCCTGSIYVIMNTQQIPSRYWKLELEVSLNFYLGNTVFS